MTHTFSALTQLYDIVRQLRNPLTGCPWDKKQTNQTLAPYTIEEAYEISDAIETGDPHDLKDELGDMLFHLIFYAQIAEENGDFNFDDIAQAACDKMIRRHPHIFTRQAISDPDQWEAMKKEERAKKMAQSGKKDTFLSSVPSNLPALTRAVKLQKRAASVGFDWQDPLDVIAKIREEVAELEAEIKDKTSADSIAEEMGDVFFSCTNLARVLDIDPEQVTRAANIKFMRRFLFIEKELDAKKRSLDEATLDEMEKLWQDAKQNGL